MVRLQEDPSLNNHLLLLLREQQVFSSYLLKLALYLLSGKIKMPIISI